MRTIAWFKVDDGFWAHPKTFMLSDAAIALWLKAGTWASQMLTDGRVPAAAVSIFRSSDEAARELLMSGLWRTDGDGYRFHDWDEYQPSAEVEKAKRAKRAEDARRAACARWHGDQCGGQCEGHAEPHNRPHAPAHESSDAPEMPRPVPSRPDELSKDNSGLEPNRPDVEALLDLLDSELRANEVKRLPVRNKSNVDAMRLLIDKDGYEPDAVARIIRWCQADGFWKGNIMSPVKLREKFEQLRLHANREREQRLNGSSRADEAQNFIQRLEAIEDATDGSGEAPGYRQELR